jgi:hypothetical protein
VRDRVVQQACKLAIEPIFEANFQDTSYGFRPKRSAHQAVKAVKQALIRGWWVVDADIQHYLDRASCYLLQPLPAAETIRCWEWGPYGRGVMCPCGNRRKSWRGSGRSGKRYSRVAGSRATMIRPRRIRWDTQCALTPSAAASWETVNRPGT